jgi:hypothetical protein
VRGSLTASGMCKTQFGGKDITRAKTSGEIISLADDLKAAATDCLKKCATLFGVGLHLYFDETTTVAPIAPVQAAAAIAPATRRSTDTGRVTAPQLSKIFGCARARGMSQTDTREFAKSMFGKLPDFLTKREASALIDHLLAPEAGQ